MKIKLLHVVLGLGAFALLKDSGYARRAKKSDDVARELRAKNAFAAAQSKGTVTAMSAALALKAYQDVSGKSPQVISYYQNLMQLPMTGVYDTATLSAMTASAQLDLMFGASK